VLQTQQNNRLLLLAVYIDDGLVAGKSDEDIETLLTYLQNNFEMTIEVDTIF
jgi:hypothetical protein